jgi:hypothetical protein
MNLPFTIQLTASYCSSPLNITWLSGDNPNHCMMMIYRKPPHTFAITIYSREAQADAEQSYLTRVLETVYCKK